ncbi:hypothetical protein ACFWP7_23195 [Streptomyces sp. NPDC058470]
MNYRIAYAPPADDHLAKMRNVEVFRSADGGHDRPRSVRMWIDCGEG